MHRFPMSTAIAKSTFWTELKAKYISSHALDLVKCKWEELSLRKEERLTECNERFRGLHAQLDPHHRMSTKILSDSYGYKIENGHQGIYKDLVHYIGMRDRTPTVNQRMEHLAALDPSPNQSQLASSFNTNSNTTTKASATKMDSKLTGTTGAMTGPAKDDGLTCYN